MRKPGRWSDLLSLVGGGSLVLGSLDPLEGSVLILAGSGLLALGSYLSPGNRRASVYNTWSFVLVALGVGSLFWLSAIGGVGGSSGRSAWWGLLIVPYLAGWSIDLWGPGAARWMSISGVALGAWYLALLGVMLRSKGNGAQLATAPTIMLGVVGIATIVGCSVRLVARSKSEDGAT